MDPAIKQEPFRRSTIPKAYKHAVTVKQKMLKNTFILTLSQMFSQS